MGLPSKRDTQIAIANTVVQLTDSLASAIESAVAQGLKVDFTVIGFNQGSESAELHALNGELRVKISVEEVLDETVQEYSE